MEGGLKKRLAGSNKQYRTLLKHQAFKTKTINKVNITEKIYSVIKEAYPTLKLLQNDFFIIGSSALILTGIEIEDTLDIDILTSSKDADFLKQSWKDRCIKEYNTQDNDLFRSNFSRYNFNLLDVEILGELEVQRNNNWEQLIIQDYTVISKDEIEIKLPTIKELERILKLFGRDKDILKLGLIEKHKANLYRY